MNRTIDAASLAQVVSPSPFLVWIIRLDIVGDPVYMHTGLGPMTFAGGMGYDPQLVGYTFLGFGNVGSIDPITDTLTGSQSLNLTLPGVDLSLDYLHQIINNGDLWQRRPAWVWVATTDELGNLIGKPIRLKTGRMDQMPITIDPGNNTGTLVVTVESQAAYQGEAANYRYSDQPQVDPSDTSQSFIAWLANQTAQIGSPTASGAGASGKGLPFDSGYGRPGSLGSIR